MTVALHGASRAAASAVSAGFETLLAELPDPPARTALGETLFAVTDLLDRELPLRRALSDASVAAERRVELADRVFAGLLPDPAGGVLREVVAARWSRSGDLTDVLEELAAGAVFAAAEAEEVLDEVEDELFRFTKIIEREADLRAALADPALPAERKLALLDALLSERVHQAARYLVERAVTHPRGRRIDEALAEASRLAARRRNRIVAQVRAAVPLRSAEVDRLATELARLYRQRVSLQITVDPDLQGGLAVRVGDDLIDATIIRRVAAARRRLADG